MFDSEDVEVAERVVAACVAGGAMAIEFRNRGEQGFLTFAELLRRTGRVEPNAILGAGSIVDPSTAALYIGCGANFIVGPILNADVARLSTVIRWHIYRDVQRRRRSPRRRSWVLRFVRSFPRRNSAALVS
jgi:2-keto-3-deoxy-6-phosphogluconate aldolase